MSTRGFGSRRRAAPCLCTLLVLASGCGLPAGVQTSIGSRAQAGTRAEIALPTTRCGDSFIAHTFINGEGPFDLLLDTGAPRTRIASAAARSLRIGRSVHSIEAGGFRVTGRIRVDVRNLDLISRALGVEIDGILGYDVFHGSVLTYDFAASQVRVGGDSIAAAAAGVVPMTRGERPFLQGRIGDDPVRLLLDTGFSGGLALAGFDRLPYIDSARAIGARVRVDGVGRSKGARLDRNVSVGSLVIRTPVVINAATSRSLLGQAILRDYIVTLDQARGRAWIRAPDGSAPDSVVVPPLYGTGMVLVPDSAAFRVADVIEGTAAAEAGIVPGDRVVAVDGVPVTERGCQTRQDAASPAPRTYTVARGDTRLEFRFPMGVLVR